MWTVQQRQIHKRAGLRYPSDLTDAEWALVEPLIPPAKRGGRRRSVDLRAVLDGIFYVLATGCQWRALPKDLPPRSTRCTAISRSGPGTARCRACTRPCSCRCGSRPARRPARRPRSSTAKA
jgi:transposase